MTSDVTPAGLSANPLSLIEGDLRTEQLRRSYYVRIMPSEEVEARIRPPDSTEAVNLAPHRNVVISHMGRVALVDQMVHSADNTSDKDRFLRYYRALTNITNIIPHKYRLQKDSEALRKTYPEAFRPLPDIEQKALDLVIGFALRGQYVRAISEVHIEKMSNLADNELIDTHASVTTEFIEKYGKYIAQSEPEDETTVRRKQILAEELRRAWEKQKNPSIRKESKEKALTFNRPNIDFDDIDEKVLIEEERSIAKDYNIDCSSREARRYAVMGLMNLLNHVSKQATSGEPNNAGRILGVFQENKHYLDKTGLPTVKSIILRANAVTRQLKKVPKWQNLQILDPAQIDDLPRAIDRIIFIAHSQKTVEITPGLRSVAHSIRMCATMSVPLKRNNLQALDLLIRYPDLNVDQIYEIFAQHIDRGDEIRLHKVYLENYANAQSEPSEEKAA
jgi:hypothetical protein